MKNAAAIAVFGLVLIILVNLYHLLIDFDTLQPIRHGGKIAQLLAFIGYSALLPLFVKVSRKRTF
jgi:uncharacterized membrane protein YjfL (UPF0719 family)